MGCGYAGRKKVFLSLCVCVCAFIEESCDLLKRGIHRLCLFLLWILHSQRLYLFVLYW